MDQLIDVHLERMAELGQADRRNGCYTRWLLTELGMIELAVPRTRTFSALKVVRAYARRAKDVDRMILACFLLGLSTRKVAAALLPILGRPVSPATVSAVARQLDAAVAAFHRRPLKDLYRVVVLDGVVLRRKTGAGALARPVLVALGLRPDGKKEVIDFRLASAESAAQWEAFLADLIRRGLTGAHLDMLCVDGGAGLLAALPTAFPDVPVQRCWAHKIRNVLNKVRKPDQAAITLAFEAFLRQLQAGSSRRFGELDGDQGLVAAHALLLPRPGEDQALGARDLSVHAAHDVILPFGRAHDGAPRAADAHVQRAGRNPRPAR
jgi:transposase-like protein